MSRFTVFLAIVALCLAALVALSDAKKNQQQLSVLDSKYAAAASAPNLVLHINDVTSLTEGMGNTRNFLKVVPTAKVAMVFLSDSVYALLPGSFSSDLAIMVQQEFPNGQVTVHACNNSLIAYNIPRESLPEWVDVVPAGIWAIAMYQQAGYAYSRP